MGMLEKLFGGKISITSNLIREEISHADAEIALYREKIGSALTGLATMTDEQHVKAEADIASHRRSIARLEARRAHLSEELPAVLASEEAAEKAAADAALRFRAETARKANSKDAAALLADYDKHAAKVGDIVARLSEINDEATAVNAELRTNPVAEPVAGYSEVHRQSPDRLASEKREMRHVWVSTDQHGGETVREATLDASGKPVPLLWEFDRSGAPMAQPWLDHREIVVSRTDARPGRFLVGLESVILPPGFADGGTYHWPRI